MLGSWIQEDDGFGESVLNPFFERILILQKDCQLTPDQGWENYLALGFPKFCYTSINCIVFEKLSTGKQLQMTNL